MARLHKRHKKPWYKRAFGEISKLRQAATGLFGQILIGGNATVPYVLNSGKVDYELARQLYRNTHEDYKLGAGFAKPIINTLAGFMGCPRFTIADEDAQVVLDEYFNRWVSRAQRTHQLSLRDGDSYIYLANLETDDALYPETDSRIEYIIIPPEQVADIEINPLNRQVLAYVLKSRHKWDQDTKEYTVTQRITKDSIETIVEGDAPEEVVSGTEPNKWGFIPIVHFKNEPEETEKYGTSELEAVEPYLKAYHDVMLQAIQGSKMHSTPRLKIKVKDVKRFFEDNFPETLAAIERGESGSINLQGRELLLFGSEDDAEFIEARSATGDATALLQLIFYCIVDVSEIPEYCFGTHVPSSHASIKEQAPILVRRVARKREQVTESWQLLARMVLAMVSKATGRRFETFETTITWDAVVERDKSEYATTLKTICEAIEIALTGGFISLDAAVDTLSEYLEAVRQYISDDEELPGERERLIKTALLRARLEDGQGLEQQKKEIDNELAGAGVK
jgi:hypothetical protein